MSNRYNKVPIPPTTEAGGFPRNEFMKCVRCNCLFSTDQAERNAEVYGGNLLACPHCGQAYSVTREIKIHIDPIHTSRDEDDWGNKITQPPKVVNNWH